MPSINGRIVDRRLLVQIALMLPRPGAHEYGPAAAMFNVDVHRMIALIDTGAQATCITRSAIQRLGLVSKGKKMMGNANSDEIHDTIAFRLAFVLPETDDAAERLWHVDRALVGADIKPNPNFEILLGMDVIEMGDLSTTRDGRFTFILP